MPARSSTFAPLLAVAVLAAAPMLLAAPAVTDAKGKKKAAKPKPACGINYLPLVEGAQWTYESFDSPQPITAEDQAQLTKWAWVSPPAPGKIVIRVLAIEVTKDLTTVTLEEKTDDLLRKTTVTCTKLGLQIDPQSFFFALEPGGALLSELSDLKRVGGMPGAKGWKKAGKLVTGITAKLTRKPTEATGAKLTNGTVEVERTIYPALFESVATPTGKHDKSARIEFEIAGRVAVAPKLDKRIEIPLRWRGYMWFKPGIGLVQGRNRIGQWFQLTEHNLN